MKKHIIAAVLIGAFAAPALADTGFYIVFDSMTKKCATMTTKPTDMSRYKMMGTLPDPGRSSDRDGRHERVQDVGMTSRRQSAAYSPYSFIE